MWRMLRRSDFIKGKGSSFRFSTKEGNDHFVGVSNCDFAVDSEPWTNLNFNGLFPSFCVMSWAKCSTSQN